MEKPDVDYIKGVSPAIAIEQKVSTKNPRSTVGTTTEIYDYLKLLLLAQELRIRLFLEILSEKIPLLMWSTGCSNRIRAKSLNSGALILREGRSLQAEIQVLMQGYTRIVVDERLYFWKNY
jgi:excinuclease ABC subunit A